MTCALCGDPLPEQRSLYPGGPVKKYCSAKCRHRAWRERERAREAAEDDEAIERRFQAARLQQRRAAA